MKKGQIKIYLALVQLAGVDPGLDVGDLLHEGRVRDDWGVHAEGDDALKVARGDCVVARPEAFTLNCHTSGFWISLLLNQVLWVFASPSRNYVSHIVA